MTTVELAVVGTPEAFLGTEDNAAELLREWGGFCLVAAEGGNCGPHEWGLTDSIGVSCRLAEGPDCLTSKSGIHSSHLLAFFLGGPAHSQRQRPQRVSQETWNIFAKKLFYI